MPTVQLQDGALDLGTATFAMQLGQMAGVFLQDFDAVTPPALPAGWTTATSGGASLWVTSTAQRDTLPNAAFWFLPLMGGERPVALLAVSGDAPAIASAEGRHMVEAMARQVALAAERTRLVGQLQEARVTGETERLRSALLASISHDLRTPLASIIGSATSLLEYGDRIPPGEQQELLRAVLEEAERLNRYIQNLLDMTRGHGGLKIQRDWVAPADIVASALNQSWWDTVDTIAGDTAGVHFKRFPDVREKYLAKWRASDNFWLRRTTILFQLNYKQETDFDLLCEVIRENLGSKEFFINKAIGWALRQYARTDPKAVKKFVTATKELRPLSRREAMKHV